VAIVSSVIEEMGLQKDGRSWVREAHTDHLGFKHIRNYLAGAGLDTAAELAAYAVHLNEDTRLGEILRNIDDVTTNGSLATPSTEYSTPAQNFTGLKLAYAVATRVEAIMIGDFFNTLTNNQLQNAFGLTAGQVTTLRTNKLAPAASLATSIRAASGQ
jgi:hypothetical protein